MSSDAQIAREWASKALDNNLLDVPITGYVAAARYILATTQSLTMADVEWDDEVHAGLCAEHPHYGLVRMMHEVEEGETIDCILPGMSLLVIRAEELTPLPGTRVDLTPRREPEPKSATDHPTVLITEEDYQNAPEGTVVAASEETPWTKWDDNLWKHVMYQDRGNLGMRERPRQVLRWGWKA